MLRRLLTTLAACAAFFAWGPTASAQYFVGGWGGWGGGATSAVGDIARGEGALAAGMGSYNVQTAEAASINAQTRANWNEYMYQSQLNVNRRYWAKVARNKDINVKAQETIYLRLRDNPSKYDIYRGDAMNVLADELANPKIYARSLPTMGAKVPGDMIRDIPFQYASAAITTSIHHILTRGSAPEPLKSGDLYKEERTKLRVIADKIRESGETNAELDPEMLDEAETLIKSLQAKVAKNVPANTRQRTECDNYLKSALGLSKMLRTPAINVILSDAAKRPEVSLGDVLGFMRAFNLRFGVADDPRERMAYDKLYPLLLAVHREAYPDRKMNLPEAEPEAPPPTEFFSKLEEKPAAPANGATPAPPPPAPTRPR